MPSQQLAAGGTPAPASPSPAQPRCSALLRWFDNVSTSCSQEQHQQQKSKKKKKKHQNDSDTQQTQQQLGFPNAGNTCYIASSLQLLRPAWPLLLCAVHAKRDAKRAKRTFACCASGGGGGDQQQRAGEEEDYTGEAPWEEDDEDNRQQDHHDDDDVALPSIKNKANMPLRGPTSVKPAAVSVFGRAVFSSPDEEGRFFEACLFRRQRTECPPTAVAAADVDVGNGDGGGGDDEGDTVDTSSAAAPAGAFSHSDVKVCLLGDPESEAAPAADGGEEKESEEDAEVDRTLASTLSSIFYTHSSASGASSSEIGGDSDGVGGATTKKKKNRNRKGAKNASEEGNGTSGIRSKRASGLLMLQARSHVIGEGGGNRKAGSRGSHRFASGEQQDAFDFFLALLEQLHTDLSKPATQPTSPGDGDVDCTAASGCSGYTEIVSKKAHETEEESMWRWQKELLSAKRGGKGAADSGVMACFRGLCRTTVQCSTCNRKRLTFDPFMSLFIELQSAFSPSAALDDAPPQGNHKSGKKSCNKDDHHRETATMKAAGHDAAKKKKLKKQQNESSFVKGPSSMGLEHLIDQQWGGGTGSETISGYKCEFCEQTGDVAKLTTLTPLLPPCLLIHLKRFTWDGRKVKTFLQTPLMLSINTTATSSHDQRGGGEGAQKKSKSKKQQQQQQHHRYALVGTVSHHGNSLASGHYTAKYRTDSPHNVVFGKNNKFGTPLSSSGGEGGYTDGADEDIDDGYGGSWVMCDDDDVSPTDVGSVASDPDVYLLLYVRTAA